ncbi:MAG: fibronectin type III domain-containing protein [Candidatus Micrarchaeia archaeon]|jgi:hypothetical protein
MFEEEGSHYWLLAIVFIGAILIISALYFAGIIRPSSAPEAPKNINIIQISNTIKITWLKSISPDLLGYNIYRSKQVGAIGEKLNLEPINTTEYIDSSLIEDGTYFYLIKAVNQVGIEDTGFLQNSYYYDTLPPTKTKIQINQGEKYTNNNRIKLYVESLDSDMCRYKNENLDWSDFSLYTLVKEWELINEEGLRRVYYQCQDKNQNLGPIVNASIWLDKTKPEINFNTYLETYFNIEDEINFEIQVSDNYQNLIECFVLLNSQEIDKKSQIYNISPINFSFSIAKQDVGNYTLNLICKDEAGNENIIEKEFFVTEEEYKSKYINILINQNSSQTNSRDVKLYLSSTVNNIEKCRFRNELRTWSDLEFFNNIIDWTLINEEGTRTVYVECFDINNKSLGINWDIIEYKKSSNGGDTTTYKDVPKNLNIKINGGKECTNTFENKLYLSAEYANLCRFKNEGEINWTKWENYRNSKNWDISGGSEINEGTHEIFYQCKNDYGESQIVSTSIIYDITPPEGEIRLFGEQEENGKIKLSWFGLGLNEENIEFNIYRKGTLIDRDFSLVKTEETNYWIDENTKNEQEYSYYIKLVDCAGNLGTETSDIISIVADSEEPNIEIENPYEGESFDEINIDLEFYVEDNISELLECQYKAGGNKKDLGAFSVDQTHQKSIKLTTNSGIAFGEEEITIYLYCTDEAGNEKQDSVEIIYIHDSLVPEIPEGPGDAS